MEAGLECSAVDLQERGPDGLLQVLKNRQQIAGEPTTFQDGDQNHHRFTLSDKLEQLLQLRALGVLAGDFPALRANRRPKKN